MKKNLATFCQDYTDSRSTVAFVPRIQTRLEQPDAIFPLWSSRRTPMSTLWRWLTHSQTHTHTQTHKYLWPCLCPRVSSSCLLYALCHCHFHIHLLKDTNVRVSNHSLCFYLQYLCFCWNLFRSLCSATSRTQRVTGSLRTQKKTVSSPSIPQ